MIAATLPAQYVNRCGRLVHPEHQWDVGHVVGVEQATRLGWTRQQIDDPSNLGPAHVRCNRSDGGKEGRAKQLARTRQDRRLPSW